jgi:hypothetical protein
MGFFYFFFYFTGVSNISLCVQYLSPRIFGGILLEHCCTCYLIKLREKGLIICLKVSCRMEVWNYSVFMADHRNVKFQIFSGIFVVLPSYF